MRVAIVNLTAGGLSGGYLKYLRRLVPLLTSHPEIESLAVFAPESARAQLSGEAWPVRGWSIDDARRGFRGLKQAVRDMKPGVVFIPTANWLDFGGTPVVVMVRNMEPLERPFGGNPLREAARNLARRTMARRAVRRATQVIAVSNHVKEFLVSHWGLSADRVPVIYHGADLQDPARVLTPMALREGLTREFLFAAGSIRPARGLDDLVEALPHVRTGGEPKALVIAGRVDAGMFRYRLGLARRARRLGVADRVIWTGNLTDAEMAWCYRRCAAFVMTSRAEACPNIALEAMSQGCACVSVDHAPMPEFFGPAAVYYRAGDTAGLARVLSALTQATDMSELKAAASARASAFRWETTAHLTVAALRAAVRA